MSEKPEVMEWNPFDASEREFPITTYQPVYYAAKSLKDLKKKMREYITSMAKPYNVSYNPMKEIVEIDRNIRISAKKSSE